MCFCIVCERPVLEEKQDKGITFKNTIISSGSIIDIWGTPEKIGNHSDV